MKCPNCGSNTATLSELYAYIVGINNPSGFACTNKQCKYYNNIPL